MGQTTFWLLIPESKYSGDNKRNSLHSNSLSIIHSRGYFPSLSRSCFYWWDYIHIISRTFTIHLISMPYYIGSNCAGFTVLPTSLPQHKLRVESQIRKSMGSKLPEFGFPALCIGHEMVKKYLVFKRLNAHSFFSHIQSSSNQGHFNFSYESSRQTTEHETGFTKQASGLKKSSWIVVVLKSQRHFGQQRVTNYISVCEIFVYRGKGAALYWFNIGLLWAS